MSLVLSAAIVGNPFFDRKYFEHVLMYSRTEDQLPLCDRETTSFVLPRNPVTVPAKCTVDIRTGLNIIRKPAGCRFVISFNTLLVGLHNWDLCTTQRTEYKECSLNGEMCIQFDNTDSDVALQIGYIYISLFGSKGAIFGVPQKNRSEYVRINTFGKDGVDRGDMELYYPCYAESSGVTTMN